MKLFEHAILENNYAEALKWYPKVLAIFQFTEKDCVVFELTTHGWFYGKNEPVSLDMMLLGTLDLAVSAKVQGTYPVTLRLISSTTFIDFVENFHPSGPRTVLILHFYSLAREARVTLELGDAPEITESDVPRPETCPICTAPLTHASLATPLQCGHWFHFDCVGKRFERMNIPRCPTCDQILVCGVLSERCLQRIYNK